MNTEPTINVLSILLLLGGFSGMVFAILLIQPRKKNREANRYFAAIMAVTSVFLLNQFLVETHLMYQVPALLGSTNFAEVLFAPCLYLYVRTMTQPKVEGQRSFLHFVPSFFCAILLMPFYFLKSEEKILIANSNYIEWPGVLEYTFPIYMVIVSIQFLIYLGCSFYMLFKHTKTIKHFFSYNQDITLAWLRNFLLYNLALLMFFIYFYTAYTQSDSNIKPAMDWFFGLNVFFVFYLGFKALKQRRIFKHHNIIEENNQDYNSVEETFTQITQIKNKKKYKKSALTLEMSESILKRLNDTMKHDKPYLDSNLTLPKLAKMVATSSNYLSQVINEQMGMKFFDFVNSFRITMAKDLIINPLPHTKTILDIAMESAFNSKSAFYSAFKKQVGVTPAQFKKHILDSTM
jgi:AraC-like DNA-binding protein